MMRQLRHRLGDIADLRTTRYGWDDLIVTPAVRVQLREIISRYRFKHKVMEEWRFGARFGTGIGLSALFEGPPGTGKTMAASIIAGEPGLDLFQVDLSKVTSKYIGETEKQLATLFTEAENAGAIVLCLFAKRTEVKSSNDRYTNLKMNFLLQRIEQFSGIAILTTNFPENMDEALGRRVTTRLQFVAPHVAARRQIWENMLGSHLAAPRRRRLTSPRAAPHPSRLKRPVATLRRTPFSASGSGCLIPANVRHVKNVPGRKTDVKDAEWLAELLAHGLVPAAATSRVQDARPDHLAPPLGGERGAELGEREAVRDVRAQLPGLDPAHDGGEARLADRRVRQRGQHHR
jgi:hypothetical protein